MFDDESSSVSDDFEDNQQDQSMMSFHNGRFTYPRCLSSIILRLSDILLNQRVFENINDQHKKEIIILIQLCMQEQRCLMYKMPFFVLNFLTNNNFTNQFSRLDFLRMVTKNGRSVNPAFIDKMFFVLLNMIEPETIKENGSDNHGQFREFRRNLFTYTPACFTKAQTLILLTRICLVGFLAMHKRTDIAFLVLEIFQYVLKYNDYSATHNLKNLALLALTIMVTKDELTMIAWPIIRKLIQIDSDRMVYEILEILMIGTESSRIKKLGEDGQQSRKISEDDRINFNIS